MKKIVYFIILSLFLVAAISALNPKKIFAQPQPLCGTFPNCASCCQNGPQCVFNGCQGGYQLRDPNAQANCGNPALNECMGGQQTSLCYTYGGYGITYECDPVAPDPGTQPCPASHPTCTQASAGECNIAGGIIPPQPCTVSPGVTGNCCIWQDPDPTCGGHLQPCCGGNLACDPDPNGSLNCNSIPATGPTCCFNNDPNCGGGVPLPPCTGTCSNDANCGTGSHLGSGTCPSQSPFCCIPNTIPAGPAVFCVGNDPNIRTNDPSSGSIATAIGCIPVFSRQGFVEFLVGWAIGIAGGIALLLIIYAAFLVITSAGNPQRMQAGKELLTAAVMGLLLILFGSFVLNLIGIEILNIPGFN